VSDLLHLMEQIAAYERRAEELKRDVLALTGMPYDRVIVGMLLEPLPEGDRPAGVDRPVELPTGKVVSIHSRRRD
jgi:hypothetical protein